MTPGNQTQEARGRLNQNLFKNNVPIFNTHNFLLMWVSKAPNAWPHLPTSTHHKKKLNKIKTKSHREARLACGSLTEEAHAHVCMNGYGEGCDEEAVVGLWEAWKGEGEERCVHTLAQSHLGL